MEKAVETIRKFFPVYFLADVGGTVFLKIPAKTPIAAEQVEKLGRLAGELGEMGFSLALESLSADGLVVSVEKIAKRRTEKCLL